MHYKYNERCITNIMRGVLQISWEVYYRYKWQCIRYKGWCITDIKGSALQI